MKKIALLVFLQIVISLGVSSQTLKDVVDPETPVTWLGLDFSLLKVVADQGAWINRTPHQMFAAWNELMIAEQTKYNMAEALHRKQVKFALDVTMNHNAALPADSIFIAQASPENLPKKQEISSVINSYDFKDHTGIGVMLIARSFDKPELKGYWWITFVAMETKEIIHIQLMRGDSSGFGLRNFWSSTVYDIIKQIKSSEYKSWSKSVKSK